MSPLREALVAHLGQVLTPEVAAAIEAGGMLSFSLKQEDKKRCQVYDRLVELLLDTDAVRLIEDLAFVVHVWDDLVDADKAVTADQVTSAFTKAIVGFGSNPFFIRYASQLTTVMHAGILNWQGANQLEAIGTPHALQVSHVVRCSVGDVAVLAAALLHGDAYASRVAAELRMLMQQDSLEDYTSDHQKGQIRA
jgi:hypothetical protein